MTSNINATLPADNAPASKADLRANLATAKSEIEALQALVGNMSPYVFNGMRNRIINGKHDIIQRTGTRASSAGSSVFVTDRWYFGQGVAGAVLTGTQGSASPQQFFPNYLRVTVSTSKTLTGTDIHYIGQRIETAHWQDLMWGTANALPATLSFWVRSSIAGTYSVFLNSIAGTVVTYVGTYTVNAPNTWEYKTVNIAGPTTGTWNTGSAAAVVFDLGSGSTYQTATLNAWQTGTFAASSTSVPLVQSLNATFDITGVQIEPGTIATPYENRLLAMEQAMCLRYYYTGRLYYQGYAAATGGLGVSTLHRAMMRAIPTITRTSEVTTNITSPAATAFIDSIQWTGSSTAVGQYVWTNIFSADAEIT